MLGSGGSELGSFLILACARAAFYINRKMVLDDDIMHDDDLTT